ncbi:MAG: hypothetical protein O3C40_08435 [Planctomycetota bacterium]|nr:hypothetical protein [Planctomycetota bacterium]
MTALACNRLGQGGIAPEHVRHTTFGWNGGTFTLRNSRITDHFWSNSRNNVADQMHDLASEQAVVYLLTYWAVENGFLHAWVVPEDVAFAAFAEFPTGSKYSNKTLEVTTEDHRLKNAPSAPSFEPYYLKSPLTDGELEKLQEAIKTDDFIKQKRLEAEAAVEDASSDEDKSAIADIGDDDWSGENGPGYTVETVGYLLELPMHTDDSDWHERNKKRYQSVLRDPTQNLVDELRAKYIQQLSPIVAGGKRHLSILKKNDYGKGGYHDHYWFAFYDPQAGSKTKSVQLFVRFLGGERVWRYGFSMGNYCGDYLERLLTTLFAHRQDVAEFIRTAPSGTIVRLDYGDATTNLTVGEFADKLLNATDSTLGVEGTFNNIAIIREYSLETLPEHAEDLIDEVGEYFRWLWPFFEVSVSGIWKAAVQQIPAPAPDETGEVDETAPKTIEALARSTALSEEFLDELEEALLAKQQAVLAGPPGTSKTYIARQFARYFVCQRHGRAQGSFDILYMHANWAYEDFFEGLKPVSNNGALNFEPRLGFFWIGSNG